MAATPPSARVPSPSLFNSLRSFGGVLLAALCTRFDLATVELEEQAIFAAQLIVAGLLAVICFATAFFFLMLLIIVLLWDYKEWVVGAILAVYLIGGIVAAAIAKGMLANRPKLLEQTLAELRKDVDGLRKPVITTMESDK